MTRDEFATLPPSLALKLVWDALHLGDHLGPMAPPRPPMPPKYDGKLYRKGGFCFMSEMTLDSLTYWHEKARESANSGGKYAAKDAKKAETLERWIAWRTVEPTALWTGERGDRRVTAAAPSRDPELHEKDAGGGSFGGPAPSDDDLPF